MTDDYVGEQPQFFDTNVRPAAKDAIGGRWLEYIDETTAREWHVQIVGHLICGWEAPSWPDEALDVLHVHMFECPKLEGILHKPTQLRSLNRLETIRAAAIELYNDPKVGRDRLGTADIADLAGVSIGTIYRYYIDRVHILDDIAPNRDMAKVSYESLDLTAYKAEVNDLL